MSESCGECGASTDREPLCEQCNDIGNNDYDSLTAEVERLRGALTQSVDTVKQLMAENAELRQKDSEAAGTLRANVAELQLVEAMRELDWFRRAWPKVVDCLNTSTLWDSESYVAWRVWLNDNPKSGAGT